MTALFPPFLVNSSNKLILLNKGLNALYKKSKVVRSIPKASLNWTSLYSFMAISNQCDDLGSGCQKVASSAPKREKNALLLFVWCSDVSLVSNFVFLEPDRIKSSSNNWEFSSQNSFGNFVNPHFSRTNQYFPSTNSLTFEITVIPRARILGIRTRL